MNDSFLDTLTIDVRKRRDIPEEVAKSVCRDALLVYDSCGMTPSQLYADMMAAQIDLNNLKNRYQSAKLNDPHRGHPTNDEMTGPQDIAAEEGGHATRIGAEAEDGAEFADGRLHEADGTYTRELWDKVDEAVQSHNNARPTKKIRVVHTLSQRGLRKGWWILPAELKCDVTRIPLNRNGKSDDPEIIGPIRTLGGVYWRIDQFNRGLRSSMRDDARDTAHLPVQRADA